MGVIRTVHHVEGAFEPAELRRACTGGLFLFVKPSMTILDETAFWEAVDTGGPAWLFAAPSCYLAVYDSESLYDVVIDAPNDGSKEDSVNWEAYLHSRLPYPTIWPEVTDWTAKRVDMIDGRPELIIGNNIVEKAKSTAHCGRCPGGFICTSATFPGVCDGYLNRHR